MLPDADLLVAGGGPAGLATALYARRAGMSVVVAEPRPSPVDKACGEGLMPGGLARLADLGVDPAGVPFRGIAYCDERGRRAEAPFAGGPGRGIRRVELHAALTEAAKAAGVEWVSEKVSGLHQDPSGVDAAGLRASWLVVAEGLHSATRRELGIRARPGWPRRVGLRAHWDTAPWSDCVEVWWNGRAEAYVTPVAPDQVGVAVLHSGPPTSYVDLLRGFPTLRGRLDNQITPVRGAGPLRQAVSARVRGRALLVGDTAGYEDALTGEGVSLALQQAEAAVRSMVDGRPQAYEQEWRRITRDYRLLTRGLVLATKLTPVRSTIVPAATRLPALFTRIVNRLAAP